MNTVYLAHLKQLITLRLGVILGQIVTITTIYRVVELPLPLLPISLCLLVACIVNGLAVTRYVKKRPVTERELFFHLLADTLTLAAFLYFSGGSTNPLVSLFLLQVIIAASTLRSVYTWWMAAISILCYSLLLRYYIAVPYFHHHHLGDYFNAHILGMWLGFLLSALLVAYYVTSIRLALQRTREQLLEERHIVELGTLAIGTAHELGTPLATMNLLTGEMKQDYAHLPKLTEQLDVLHSQIMRCKTIISAISMQAGSDRGEASRQFAIHDYIAHTLRTWKEMRPQALITSTCNGTMPAPTIIADIVLDQAIINVLNNAADSSQTPVDIKATWDSATLRIEICDQGESPTKELLPMIGTPFFTTKKDGQGLGVFLSRSVINRLGGTLTFEYHHGMHAVITLPLAQLSVTHHA